MIARTALLLGLLLFTSPQDRPDVGADFETRLARGRAAAEAGDGKAALHHLQQALVLAPFDSEALGLALASSIDDKDARVLWAHAWTLATMDASGSSPKRAAELDDVARAAPGAAETALLRAEAVAELAKLVKDRKKRAGRAPAQGLVAEWASELAGRLAEPSPALLERYADALGYASGVTDKHIDGVVGALKRTHSRALSNGEYDVALRAARILNGLAAQGAFEDLQGDPPRGLEALRRAARDALEESRRKLATALEEPWTIDQLQDLSETEARSFTLEHADLSNPGRAYSPRGWYVVETSCGWETLLGVARTVEDHHERLSNWYGQDPFEGVPGLIRVLPEASGLEAEGAPFWWAGGFQSGNVTTARFSCSSIEGFGGLLTHELTHRFDGALYPGIPSWLAEGKAVWTGGSYGAASDETFVEDHVQFGTIQSAWFKGYGGEDKLTELVTGALEDYRDNYVAGYALYAYLKLWQEPTGTLVYAPRLEAYQKGLSGNRKQPLEWFTANFADGAEGRPEDFTGFAAAFQEFLKGFYWEDRAAWTDRYIEDVERAGGGWVYDAPTWSWARSRAEPFWGQDHARAAGDLFLELDRPEEAGDAYLWALTVDERTPRRAMGWGAVLASAGEADGAWALASLAQRTDLFARVPGAASDTAPFELPRTRALLARLGVEAAALREDSRGRAAAALEAEQAELGRWLGEAPGVIDVPVAPAVAQHPFDPTPRRLGLEGWVEADLTGYEEKRAEHCWYVEDDGDLHVGRFEPRDATGLLDRYAHQRHAYTHTVGPQPAGRYALRCRVQFTTSYVNGALILGYGRRDRNIRLGFSAGDFYYSIGKKEAAEEIERVGWRINGLRERDGPLGGSLGSGAVTFEEPRTNFELLAIVDGAAVHFWIEGQFLGSYHDATGTPIEGHLGFATSQGAIRVIEPEVQRLDRSREARLPLPLGVDDLPVDASLDLTRPPTSSFRRFLNRPVLGLRPNPRGTLLVWIPMEEWADGMAEFLSKELTGKAVDWAERARKMLRRVDAETPLLFAVPDRLDETALGTLREALSAELSGLPFELATYPWVEPDLTGEEDKLPIHRSWLCFIDSAGVLRFCDRFYGFSRALPDDVVHWVTVFRDDDGRR